MKVLMGLKSTIGDRTNWSVDEMIAFLDAHPDTQSGLDENFRYFLLWMLFRHNESVFLDYENGICNLDSAEFRKLVELVEKCQPTTNRQINRVAEGDVLLNGFENSLISGYGSLETFYSFIGRTGLGQEVTALGFPMLDGSSGIFLDTGGIPIYAILSTSGNQEGAWKFVENTLASPLSETNSVIPAKTADLEADIAKVLENAYEKDAEGNVLTNEDGTPVRKVYSTNTHSDGMTVFKWTSYYPTESDAEYFRELLANAKICTLNEGNVVGDIISEEMQSYFSGQKNLDEVLDIIQSKVQLYLSESRLNTP